VADRRQGARPAQVSLSWDQVRARRLRRSALTDPASDLIDVVRRVGGIHAQVQLSAELQLAARVDGITQDDVRDALWRDRALVKAWTLRGTLHLHPAGELPLWFAARRAVMPPPAGLPAWTDPQGVVHSPVSIDELTELEATVRDSFRGRVLTRDELATEVVRRVGKKHEGRLRSGFAFFLGELVQGPPQGSKITLALAQEWVEGWNDVDERDALREVLRRFLWAYGPARPSALRAWFGEVPFDLVDVEEVDVEGGRAFVLAGDTDFPEPQPSVRLLPEYDVYVMGFRERDELVPARVREQVAAHGRGKYEGPAGVRFLLVNGVAAGLWERKKLAKQLEVRVAPAHRVRRAAIQQEVERFAAFFGLTPVLTID
jgi:DNA glycosylase AlkZ-like